MSILGVVSFSLIACTGEKDPGKTARPENAHAAPDAWDTAMPGTLPSGWRLDATAAGKGGTGAALASWAIFPDAAAPTPPRLLGILAADHGQEQTYNLCWTDTPSFRDGRLAVRFQARSGTVDQGGGLMWRVRDRDHYYICRANPLESNFRVYKVIGGVRTQLGSIKVDLPVAEPGSPGRWHTIVVEHHGDRILCTLDGKWNLNVTDESLTQPGGIGVWTKADAVTWFDGLVIAPATESQLPEMKGTREGQTREASGAPTSLAAERADRSGSGSRRGP